MAPVDLFQKWRLANEAAMAAARLTFHQSMLAMDGRGEPPSEAQTEHARALRGIADDLFELGIARMGEALAARAATQPQPPSASTWL